MGKSKDGKPKGIRVLWETLLGRFALVGFILGFLWLVLLVNWAIYGADSVGLCRYGIQPRKLDGLIGILFAPFLHVGVEHLAANALPFLVFGCLMMLRGIREFLFTVVAAILVGGAAVWLVGSSGVHIGVSGVVFGLMGCLILVSVLERRVLNLFIIILVVVFDGLILLVLISDWHTATSVESHVFGFLSGVGVALWLTRQVRRERREARERRQMRKAQAAPSPEPESQTDPSG
ncbi:MAG: rhomboid family intramembrane serine protease [Myxococcales bacterium]|nr:rhomboid family intramembrane serine protease [Myxococcales bacterium]